MADLSDERLLELVKRTVVPDGRDAYGLSNQETASINSALRELQDRRERERWRPMEPEDQFPSGANVTDNTGCDV